VGMTLAPRLLSLLSLLPCALAGVGLLRLSDDAAASALSGINAASALEFEMASGMPALYAGGASQESLSLPLDCCTGLKVSLMDGNAARRGSVPMRVRLHGRLAVCRKRRCVSGVVPERKSSHPQLASRFSPHCHLGFCFRIHISSFAMDTDTETILWFENAPPWRSRHLAIQKTLCIDSFKMSGQSAC